MGLGLLISSIGWPQEDPAKQAVLPKTTSTLPSATPAQAGVLSTTSLPKTVFEGTYLHRTGGRNYLKSTIVKQIASDGSEIFNVEMRTEQYSLTTDGKGRPKEYKVSTPRGYSAVFSFKEGQVIWKRNRMQKGAEEFRWKPAREAWPDFNSRPDPYCIQNALLRQYDLSKGGLQTFAVFDIDGAGLGFAEYQIEIANVGDEDTSLPAGRFKTRHLVQTQMTPSRTWYKKGAGSKTDYWIGEDRIIYRVLRNREPYEMLLVECKR
jgi:hypothetical protein